MFERRIERRQIRRERRDAREPRVEAEHRRLVAGLQRSQHVARGLPRINRLGSHPHTAADVKKHRELDWPIGLCAEIENRPGLTGFGYDEIFPLEVSNEASLPIANHGADGHDVDRRAKCGNWRLLSEYACD